MCSTALLRWTTLVSGISSKAWPLPVVGVASTVGFYYHTKLRPPSFLHIPLSIEFNRLVPEVLSVCTVQFKSVCDGIKAESTRIVIESDEISLDPTCGAFITMNPGYLGRSELPEGLKALFRPITVMVPDLVLICENSTQYYQLLQ